MRKSSAFTLIELVIVIAIIGILASLAFPKFLDISEEAKISKGKAGLGALRALLATRYAASGTGGAVASYPTSLSATDFANGERPINPIFDPAIYSDICARAVPDNCAVWASFPCTFWYVSDPGSADYGKAGTFSTLTVDTCAW